MQVQQAPIMAASPAPGADNASEASVGSLYRRKHGYRPYSCGMYLCYSFTHFVISANAFISFFVAMGIFSQFFQLLGTTCIHEQIKTEVQKAQAQQVAQGQINSQQSAEVQAQIQDLMNSTYILLPILALLLFTSAVNAMPLWTMTNRKFEHQPAANKVYFNLHYWTNMVCFVLTALVLVGFTGFAAYKMGCPGALGVSTMMIGSLTYLFGTGLLVYCSGLAKKKFLKGQKKQQSGGLPTYAATTVQDFEATQ